MKIRIVGAEMMHVDGLTDMTKLIFVFRNFAKAPDHMKKFSSYLTEDELRLHYKNDCFCKD